MHYSTITTTITTTTTTRKCYYYLIKVNKTINMINAKLSQQQRNSKAPKSVLLFFKVQRERHTAIEQQ